MKYKFLFTIFLISLSIKGFCVESFQDGTFLAGQQGRETFLACLKNAEGPVTLAAYKLHGGILPDKEILECVKSLTDQKVIVKLYAESRLNPEEKRGYVKLPEKASLKAFQASGALLVTNIQNYNNVHIKLLLTQKYAVLGTTNYDGIPALDPGREWRDFSCILTDQCLLDELKSTLRKVEEGDIINWPLYEARDIKDHETRLTWGPGQHKNHLLQLIQMAEKDISIYQQDLTDTDIVEALKAKATGGISVRILMSYHPFGENNKNNNYPNLLSLVKVGAYVRLTGKVKVIENRPLHIHAKVMIIDGKIMYLGSANFYPSVLNPAEKNLNLGILTREMKFINPVTQTFEKDWNDHIEHEFKGGDNEK